MKSSFETTGAQQAEQSEQPEAQRGAKLAIALATAIAAGAASQGASAVPIQVDMSGTLDGATESGYEELGRTGADFGISFIFDNSTIDDSLDSNPYVGVFNHQFDDFKLTINGTEFTSDKLSMSITAYEGQEHSIFFGTGAGANLGQEGYDNELAFADANLYFGEDGLASDQLTLDTFNDPDFFDGTFRLADIDGNDAYFSINEISAHEVNTTEPTPIPEPSTLALLGLGLAALGARRLGRKEEEPSFDQAPEAP